MLYLKVKIEADSKASILEASGGNTQHLRTNLEALRDLWIVEGKRIGDCHEVRLMGEVLFSSLTPINAAIIVDNVDYFESHYNKKSVETDEKFLKVACLCGAEKIGNFLLDKCENALKEYDFILTYVSASPNKEWAESIAKNMHDKQMEIPKGVYLYCADPDRIASIANIFNPKSNSVGLVFKG